MKSLNSIRKYMIGIIIGAALSYTVTAYGEDISKIGHKVQGEYKVVVDGTPLTQKSIGVDGSAYAPLRAIGEATGYDVTFKDNTVYFTQEKGADIVPATDTGTTGTTSTTTTDVKKLKLQIENLENEIATKKDMLELNQKFVDGFEKAGNADDPQAKVFRNSVQLLQSQIEELEKQKAELESQINK